MTELTRRDLLRGLSTTTAGALLAGCNELGTDTTTTEGQETVLTETPTETPVTTPVERTPTTTVATESAMTTLTETPTETPTETASPTATQQPLLPLAEEFVGYLSSGRYEDAHEMFSSTVQRQLTLRDLTRLWLGVTAQHGDFQTIEDSREPLNTKIEVDLQCQEAVQPMSLVFSDGEITGLSFDRRYTPPDYADTSTFTERSATIENKECSLNGTVSVPTDLGDETVPGVVLVHGSGPSDRDQTVASATKNLKDLAWGLATRGVAVFRYDKRTFACSVEPTEQTLDNIVVDDAVAALDVLREQPEVDPDQAFVVGHSLGAMATPRIAARDGGLAGGAMLAAPGRKITELFIEQYRHSRAVDGELTEAEKETIAGYKERIERLENRELGESGLVGQYSVAWFYSLFDYDHIAKAKDVSLPLFLLQGGRDFQVSPEKDFGKLQTELGDRADTRFELYPDLSHMFFPGSEPSLATEYLFPDNLAKEVVVDLAGWIDDQVA
jgi:pimeloyl-ACP methyl ester carboxylesterase